MIGMVVITLLNVLAVVLVEGQRPLLVPEEEVVVEHMPKLPIYL
jgi:hypothetical protein